MKSKTVKNIVSLSGGKDSTAMLHMMMERGENIHSVVMFDTGWEFPEMYGHLTLVEKKTGLDVVRIKPDESFNFVMFEREIKKKGGELNGIVHRYGNGWPTMFRRWCSKIKIQSCDKYIKKAGGVDCVGIASDEDRVLVPGKRYPLVEYGVTEASALEYCFGLGYDWGGLYDWQERVSCWCCPLKGKNGFRKLRKNKPELWYNMMEMEKSMRFPAVPLLEKYSWFDLELMFIQEDKQLNLF